MAKKRFVMGGTPADEGILAAKLERITRVSAREVMEAVDEATKASLAGMGLEAFRFDADACPEERWMVLKIKIRPVGRV